MKDHPLPGNKLGRGIYLMVRRYYQHGVARDSAALAYYLLFMLFPFLIFISSLIGLLHLDVAAITTGLQNLIPKEVVDFLELYLSYVSQTSSSRMMWFGLVFSIYFPMRATNSLILSVRTAYHLGPPSKVLLHQLKTLIYTVFLILTIGLSLALVTVGNRMLDLLVTNFHLPKIFASWWASLRFPALGLILAFALGSLYALAQDRRQPLRNILPGILFSLVMWMTLSMLFSFYVENFANYTVIYGSIGAVIVLMIWLYLSATTLVMGAEFNGMLMSMRKDWRRVDKEEEK
ncbi:YihY/virulence factor BrkB family protein [Oscillibacter hominis]|uniref:YihY/virulence factor BrkB family protein n=1 Tax=Oscillibacter hominis TaxID=2763056 RepID=A0A7G9B228_9FIRM|nr:YihY/virulence factor BrkB family protein [Oscillibacter hominis]QNL43609.1 YihY/virulence factor BrkB family protein [Oscillibacter hominis]